MNRPTPRPGPLPIALVLLAVLVGSISCARGDDPKPAVTGQQNIGSATPPSTAARSATTTPSATSATAGGSGTSGTSPTSATTPTRPNAVDIHDYSFLPVELHVPVGTAVTWTNTESDPPVEHYVKSSPGQPGDIDSGRLPPGQSYNKTFGQAGTYAYFCDIHNFMKATVVVQ